MGNPAWARMGVFCVDSAHGCPGYGERKTKDLLGGGVGRCRIHLRESIGFAVRSSSIRVGRPAQAHLFALSCFAVMVIGDGICLRLVSAYASGESHGVETR